MLSKVLFRRASCLVALGFVAQARSDFQEALDCCSPRDSPAAKAIERELELLSPLQKNEEEDTIKEKIEVREENALPPVQTRAELWTQLWSTDPAVLDLSQFTVNGGMAIRVFVHRYCFCFCIALALLSLSLRLYTFTEL
jgi:hypothetical protein